MALFLSRRTSPNPVSLECDDRTTNACVSPMRNMVATRRFVERAIASSDTTPRRVITDTATTYPPALAVAVAGLLHGTGRYSANGIERDHGFLKERLRPMRGLKSVASAAIFVSGHALMRRIRRGVFQIVESVPQRLSTSIVRASVGRTSWQRVGRWPTLVAHALRHYAAMCGARGDHRGAVRIFSALSTVTDSPGTTMVMASLRTGQEADVVAAARWALGDEDFAAACAEGRSITLEQVTAEVLRNERD
jgi:hypothetical protein